MDKLKGTFFQLLLPLTAYTLFIQCGQWINHYWVAINAVETFDYVINADILFFMFIALGVVVSSFFLDKYGETQVNKNAGLISALISAGILDMATTKPHYIPNAFVNFRYYTRFSSLFFSRRQQKRTTSVLRCAKRKCLR